MRPIRLLFGTDSDSSEAIRSAFAAAGFEVSYRTEPGERALAAERDAGWNYLILEHRPPERDAFRVFQANEELQLRDRAMQALGQGILITDANRPDHPIIYASPRSRSSPATRARKSRAATAGSCRGRRPTARRCARCARRSRRGARSACGCATTARTARRSGTS